LDASGLPEDGGVGDHGGHHVGVHVGRRPAVLEVALAVLLCLPAHAHRRATVGHSLHDTNTNNSWHTDFADSPRCRSSRIGRNEGRTQLKVLMSAVSCLPVRRRSLPSP